MESLIKEMQDPETGVPVRSQKLFLSVIPSAFMGEFLLISRNFYYLYEIGLIQIVIYLSIYSIVSEMAIRVGTYTYS